MIMQRIGVILKVLILYVNILLNMLFLIDLPSQADVQRFTRQLLFLTGLYAWVYEPIALLIIATCFKLKDGKGKFLYVVTGIFYGNFHPNMTRSVLYSINAT